MTDLRPLHALALAQCTELLGRVGESAWGRATPCSDWDLAALVAHMVGQNRGFAAAVRAGDAPAAAYRPVALAPAGLPSAWAVSADELRAVLAAADLARPVRLVEVSPDAALPVRAVVGISLLDTVVHTWDVAVSTGADHRPPAELLPAVEAVAELVPTGPARTQPGAAFAAPVQVEDPDRFAAVLARLGRAR